MNISSITPTARSIYYTSQNKQYALCLYKEWSDWVRESQWSVEKRSETMERLLKCFYNEDSSLDLCDFWLRDLPDHLPPSITHLVLNRNNLTKLPDNLPPLLTKLDVMFNCTLKELPENLPLSLIDLNASNNDINKLPRNLPLPLRRLNVFNNAITELPSYLPNSLYFIDVRSNELTRLPSGFESLPSTTKIYMEGNPLPKEEVNRIKTIINKTTYNGPKIIHNLINDVIF